MMDIVHLSSLRSGSGCRVVGVQSGNRYSVKLAESKSEIAQAQKLRFEVFNLELNQGLAESYLTGRDEDLFDQGCDHLMVRENATGLLVGTYRLQTGTMARAHHDYYSAGEFDLSRLDAYRPQIVEIGRACVHKSHRNSKVLAMLWKGIAGYMGMHGSRYVLGCSSIDSQNPLEGLAIYEELTARNIATEEFRVQPWPDCVCNGSHPLPKAPKLPGLLNAYLSLGAIICGPPAIDREFGTIDFLTLLDLQKLNARAAQILLGPEWKQLFGRSIEPSPSLS